MDISACTSSLAVFWPSLIGCMQGALPTTSPTTPVKRLASNATLMRSPRLTTQFVLALRATTPRPGSTAKSPALVSDVLSHDLINHVVLAACTGRQLSIADGAAFCSVCTDGNAIGN